MRQTGVGGFDAFEAEFGFGEVVPRVVAEAAQIGIQRHRLVAIDADHAQLILEQLDVLGDLAAMETSYLDVESGTERDDGVCGVLHVGHSSPQARVDSPRRVGLIRTPRAVEEGEHHLIR
ncbi:hypothetical protein GCM10027271_56660 [Saccharopolyspora gloriosae]